MHNENLIGYMLLGGIGFCDVANKLGLSDAEMVGRLNREMSTEERSTIAAAISEIETERECA